MRAIFDPRTQLLVVLIASGAVFLVDLSKLWQIIAFMAVYLIVQGMHRLAIRYLVIAAFLIVFQEILVRVGSSFFSSLSFLAYLGLRFLPVLMGAGSLGRVPSGKLIAALTALRLPRGLLISLAVSFRFLPIMRLEYEAIQTSAQLRGVSVTSPRNWLRPLRTFEYTIVPLLMRSLKISDELAASATTKGIDYPGQKTSIHTISFGLQDIIVLVAYTGWLVVVFQYGG
ncbi:energy-coupling factor transport system permease protein [Fontibacillus panacisegetis]|uniref:Energy-coupling factor transport system permease protein n=1 Tax=Fontibacillus panacisegetis TaxID=670482 RepID=A0A1G7RM78_9BACL|nr:energy-coupling factor transporter transmembrane component T [Fontibacillus panacisegetis]SDG11190.1 energy-coupling factor transport system permease protein [Fontibacillus panacisegetis]